MYVCGIQVLGPNQEGTLGSHSVDGSLNSETE